MLPRAFFEKLPERSSIDETNLQNILRIHFGANQTTVYRNIWLGNNIIIFVIKDTLKALDNFKNKKQKCMK